MLLHPSVFDGKDSRHVLVADDEYAVLELTSQFLERFGFTVIPAENGHQAVQLFTEHIDNIQLVVLDCNMPVLGGEDAFREMYALRSELKAIFTTGYDDGETAADIRRLPTVRFLQKPFKLDQFLAIVRRMTEQDDVTV